MGEDRGGNDASHYVHKQSNYLKRVATETETTFRNVKRLKSKFVLLTKQNLLKRLAVTNICEIHTWPTKFPAKNVNNTLMPFMSFSFLAYIRGHIVLFIQSLHLRSMSR